MRPERPQPPHDLTIENLPSHLEVLIEATELRVPVISDEDGERFEGRGGYESWQRVGGALLRAVQSGHVAAETLIPLLQEPVSEGLPSLALHMVKDSSLMRDVLEQNPMIAEITSLPEVPDEQIGPSLRGIRELLQVRDLQSYSETPGGQWLNLRDDLEAHSAAGNLTKGVTRAEQGLVTNRYQMARCVKLAALGAELLEQCPSLGLDNRLTLPSGTVIGVVPGQEMVAEGLLDVSSWHERHELHDRVFRTGNFVLKEHKGGRHALTLDLPDMFTASSEREVEIAADFMRLGTIADGDVSVSWEKPIGFVCDPSGFDFSMFEYEENLITREDITSRLTRAILSDLPNYKNEYVATQARVQDEANLDWDTFAQAKAYLLIQHARQLARRISLQNGYTDRDNSSRILPVPDHEFRIHATETGPHLELVGMDFEHFERLDTQEAEALTRSYNDLIDKGPVDTANILVRGLQGNALKAAEAIVAQLHSEGKRHLPEKIS